MNKFVSFLLLISLTIFLISCDSNLIVTNGTGSGAYQVGENIQISANKEEGMIFYRWEGFGHYQVKDRYLETTTINLNKKDVEVTAVNISVDEKYDLTLQGASGEGNFKPGTLITIKTDTTNSGECFKTWSGDTALIDNLHATEVSFRMPRNHVRLIAEFDDSYNVTITSGTGSGMYCPDHTVSIKANFPPSDSSFSGWIGDTTVLASTNSEITSFKMVRSNVSLEATYKLNPTPTPIPKNLRLIAIGDSITQGISGYTNWRCHLWYQLNSEPNFPKFDFTGSMAHPYGGTNHACSHAGFDGDNEGHWGWKTDEVLNVLKTSAYQAKADVAIIHMGTNDIRGGQSNASTVNEISTMIDYLRAANPTVRVFVAGVIPNVRENVDHYTRDLNERIKNFAPTKSTTNSPVIFVDQYSGFNPSTDLRDKIHPSGSGNIKIADKWFQAIRNLLVN